MKNTSSSYTQLGIQSADIMKQTKILCGYLDNYSVKLANVSTRCSSHPQGKSEARCENAGISYDVFVLH